MQQPVLEPLEQQRPVREAGQGIMQRLVADLVVGRAVRERVGDDVRDRLQEAELVRIEASRCDAVRAEHPERPLLAPDDHADAAAHPVVAQQRSGVEACLTLEVVDGDAAERPKREAGVELSPDRHITAPDDALLETRAGAQQEGLAVLGDLEQLAHVDAENVPDRRCRGVEQVGQLEAFERHDPELGDRRLLLAPARYLTCGPHPLGHVLRDREPCWPPEEADVARTDLDLDRRSVAASMALPSPPRAVRIRAAEVGDGHGEELLAQVAVGGDGGVVDVKERERARVVHPHRQWAGLEQLQIGLGVRAVAALVPSRRGAVHDPVIGMGA